MMTKTRSILLIIVAVGLLAIVAVWYITLHMWNEQVYKIDIATDKSEYQAGETVHIRITNYEDHTVEILCPNTCALGNFPTTLEKTINDEEWDSFAVFCPSIEPLFGEYETQGDYIVHPLTASDSYDLEISNFEAFHLKKAEQLRILYYLDSGHTTILSAPFTMNP
jgi:hypothetical protein